MCDYHMIRYNDYYFVRIFFCFFGSTSIQISPLMDWHHQASLQLSIFTKTTDFIEINEQTSLTNHS